MASIEKRTSESGEVSYRVKVRLKGAATQTATFKRLTDVRLWAQSTEAAIREGRHFKTTEAKRRTVGEMIDRYIAGVLPGKPKSAKRQRQQLEWWKRQIGHTTLADAMPSLIGECRDTLAGGVTVRGGRRSPSTVTRYLAALSHAFTIAVKEWGWLDDNPLRKVTKPKEPRGRVRYLSDDERARLVAACKESDSAALYPAVVLALCTGARRMEIMSLRWGQVDFSRRAITVLETKNGEIRSLPLVGHAFDLMEGRAKVRRIDTDLVFPGRIRNSPVDLRTPFENALKRAGIADFRWHDLRHSAASYLAMNGATLAEIAEVLGHKTLAMVKRYAHLSQAHTTRVVEAMNARIFG